MNRCRSVYGNHQDWAGWEKNDTPLPGCHGFVDSPDICGLYFWAIFKIFRIPVMADALLPLRRWVFIVAGLILLILRNYRRILYGAKAVISIPVTPQVRVLG